MAANQKINELEGQVKLRAAIGELLEIAQAVCRPGESVEDFVGVLELSLQNDTALRFILDAIERRAKSEATKGSQQ